MFTEGEINWEQRRPLASITCFMATARSQKHMTRNRSFPRYSLSFMVATGQCFQVNLMRLQVVPKTREPGDIVGLKMAPGSVELYLATAVNRSIIH